MTRTEGRIVLTGSAGSFAGLAQVLQKQGLHLVEHPLVRFAPPDDWRPFDDALEPIESWAAIAITSSRAAVELAARVPRMSCGVPVWATGEESAKPLSRVFTRVRVIDSSDGEGAAEKLARVMIREGVGSPVLFPCGSLHRAALILQLEGAGIEVRPVICYVSVIASESEARTACKSADAVIVASPSVARLLATSISPADRPWLIAAGPTTARAAMESGWSPDAVATRPTAAAIADALGLVTER